MSVRREPENGLWSPFQAEILSADRMVQAMDAREELASAKMASTAMSIAVVIAVNLLFFLLLREGGW